RNFLHELHRWQIMLGEVPLHRLGNPRTLHELDQSDLHGVVAVAGRALALRNYARSSLQHGNGTHLSALVKNLRHADFSSQNSRNHFVTNSSSSPPRRRLQGFAIW